MLPLQVSKDFILRQKWICFVVVDSDGDGLTDIEDDDDDNDGLLDTGKIYFSSL